MTALPPAIPTLPALLSAVPQQAAPAAGGSFASALTFTAPGRSPTTALAAPTMVTPPSATPVMGLATAPFIDQAITPTLPARAATIVPGTEISLALVDRSGPPGLVDSLPTPEPASGRSAPELVPSDLTAEPKHSATVLAAVGERLAAKGIDLPAMAKPAIAAAAPPVISNEPVPAAPVPAVSVPSNAPPALQSATAPHIGPTRSRDADRPADYAKAGDAQDKEPILHQPTLLFASPPALHTIPSPELAHSAFRDAAVVGTEAQHASITSGLAGTARTFGPDQSHAPEQTFPNDDLSDAMTNTAAMATTSLSSPPAQPRPDHDHVLPTPALHALPANAAAPAQALHFAQVPVLTAQPEAFPGTMSTPASQPISLTGAFGERIGLAIAHRVALGQDRLTVRLDPKELGRIEISLAFDEHSGALRAVVATEHSAVLEALRRDAPELTLALAAAGLPTDASSLRFDAGSDAGPRGQSSSSAGQGHGQRHGEWARWTAASVPSDAPGDSPRRHPGRGRLDLIA